MKDKFISPSLSLPLSKPTNGKSQNLKWIKNGLIRGLGPTTVYHKMTRNT